MAIKLVTAARSLLMEESQFGSLAPANRQRNRKSTHQLCTRIVTPLCMSRGAPYTTSIRVVLRDILRVIANYNQTTRLAPMDSCSPRLGESTLAKQGWLTNQTHPILAIQESFPILIVWWVVIRIRNEIICVFCFTLSLPWKLGIYTIRSKEQRSAHIKA